jgi:hypothetical protein
MVRVSLRTVTMQIPSQKIITKDNVSIDIAAVAYYHISDPAKAVIVIENVYDAINQISQTTVRNVVGRFSLAGMHPYKLRYGTYNLDRWAIARLRPVQRRWPTFIISCHSPSSC